ncbi:unnamed protein product [Urochloa humidicola]
MEDAVGQPLHKLVWQLNFPPGYHFVPTEAELLDVYLRRKIEGQVLPLGVVNEVAILDWQPGSLVEAYKGYGESKWYFFTVREPSSSNKEEEPNRKVRVPGVKATWKATGSVVPIPAAGDIVGTKRVLIYQSTDAEEDGKWSMHEYILKGHAKIGQYALCSIQRKQHSDIVDDNNAGEGSSRRKGRKRTKAANMDPGKAKKRRTKKSSILLEGVQLQHQETGPIEAQVKPKCRARRNATKRKNKASAQVDEGQQRQQEVAPTIPIKPPLTPPKEAPPQPLQQEQIALAPHGNTPVQGYPHQDGMLGASAPMHEVGTIASSFQYHNMSSFDLETLVMLGDDQEEQPLNFTASEFIADGHAQYQLNQQQDDYCNLFGIENQNFYTEQQCYLGNTTQNNSSWNHGQHHIYQQEIGDAFGAPGQHTDDQYYDQLPDYKQMYNPMLAQTGYCSSDQFTGSVQGDTAASGSNGHMDLDDDDDSFPMSLLCDGDPQDCVGTQDDDGSNPEALQSQDDKPPWSSSAQQQHTATGHGCDGPPSRSVSEFWEE